MVASLRYLDTFVKMDGAWLFAERLLYVDWLEERSTVMTTTNLVGSHSLLDELRELLQFRAVQIRNGPKIHSCGSPVNQMVALACLG